jgi:hypothetical protein
MAWTQTDVDALKAAIASGVKVVEYHDRRVEYQTTREMLEALGLMQQEVNTANRHREAVHPHRHEEGIRSVMQLNFFDKVALQVAPRWATNRIRARIMVDTLARHYEAAQPGFRTAGWRRSASDPNAAIGPRCTRCATTARDLVRNNGWARRGKQVIANNTVGWGIAANPVDSGTRAQNKARQLWKQWAGTPSATSPAT